MQDIAVIDLGTNTFHLMVVRMDGRGQWEVLCRNRVFVKLAEEGLHRIGNDAWERGLLAMRQFRQQLDAVGIAPGSVRAFGTAALRGAENSREFLAEVARETGISVEVISGKREAKLIYLGVKQAVPWPGTDPVLVMDIGGGSVEFILADPTGVLWWGSFNVGVAVLYNRFHHSDPISDQERSDIHHFLDENLSELWHALGKHPAHTLIGASGAFDTMDMLALNPDTKPERYGEIPLETFDRIFDLLVNSKLNERKLIENLPPERVEMVVVAMILIRFILHKTGIRRIITSTYALKEGMLAENTISG